MNQLSAEELDKIQEKELQKQLAEAQDIPGINNLSLGTPLPSAGFLVQQKKPPSTISGWLEQASFKNQLAMALPKHVTPDRMLRIFFTELKRVSHLKDCSLPSVLGAMIQCAQLGLEPGNHLGHAYLIPFKNNKKGGQYECQLIIGYRGMIDLVHRTSKIQSIDAHVVYESDKFAYKLGLNPILEHEPVFMEGKNVIRGAYVIVTLQNGAKQYLYMTFAEIEKARSFSAAARSHHSPWLSHYEDMAIKTVFRKLFKWLPVSVEMQRAISIDEAAERQENLLDYNDVIDMPVEDGEIEEVKNTSKAEKILGARNV